MMMSNQDERVDKDSSPRPKRRGRPLKKETEPEQNTVITSAQLASGEENAPDQARNKDKRKNAMRQATEDSVCPISPSSSPSDCEDILTTADKLGLRRKASLNFLAKNLIEPKPSTTTTTTTTTTTANTSVNTKKRVNTQQSQPLPWESVVDQCVFGGQTNSPDVGESSSAITAEGGEDKEEKHKELADPQGLAAAEETRRRKRNTRVPCSVVTPKSPPTSDRRRKKKIGILGDQQALSESESKNQAQTSSSESPSGPSMVTVVSDEDVLQLNMVEGPLQEQISLTRKEPDYVDDSGLRDRPSAAAAKHTNSVGNNARGGGRAKNKKGPPAHGVGPFSPPAITSPSLHEISTSMSMNRKRPRNEPPPYPWIDSKLILMMSMGHGIVQLDDIDIDENDVYKMVSPAAQATPAASDETRQKKQGPTGHDKGNRELTTTTTKQGESLPDEQQHPEGQKKNIKVTESNPDESLRSIPNPDGVNKDHPGEQQQQQQPPQDKPSLSRQAQVGDPQKSTIAAGQIVVGPKDWLTGLFCCKAHTTSAGILVYGVAPTGDIYFLLGKDRLDQRMQASNRWSDFSGRKKGEDLTSIETAVREFIEESMCMLAQRSFAHTKQTKRRIVEELANQQYRVKVSTRMSLEKNGRRYVRKHITFVKRIEWDPSIPENFRKVRSMLVELLRLSKVTKNAKYKLTHHSCFVADPAFTFWRRSDHPHIATTTTTTTTVEERLGLGESNESAGSTPVSSSEGPGEDIIGIEDETGVGLYCGGIDMEGDVMDSLIDESDFVDNPLFDGSLGAPNDWVEEDDDVLFTADTVALGEIRMSTPGQDNKTIDIIDAAEGVFPMDPPYSPPLIRQTPHRTPMEEKDSEGTCQYYRHPNHQHRVQQQPEQQQRQGWTEEEDDEDSGVEGATGASSPKPTKPKPSSPSSQRHRRGCDQDMDDLGGGDGSFSAHKSFLPLVGSSYEEGWHIVDIEAVAEIPSYRQDVLGDKVYKPYDFALRPPQRQRYRRSKSMPGNCSNGVLPSSCEKDPSTSESHESATMTKSDESKRDDKRDKLASSQPILHYTNSEGGGGVTCEAEVMEETDGDEQNDYDDDNDNDGDHAHYYYDDPRGAEEDRGKDCDETFLCVCFRLVHGTEPISTIGKIPLCSSSSSSSPSPPSSSSSSSSSSTVGGSSDPEKRVSPHAKTPPIAVPTPPAKTKSVSGDSPSCFSPSSTSSLSSTDQQDSDTASTPKMSLNQSQGCSPNLTRSEENASAKKKSCDFSYLKSFFENGPPLFSPDCKLVYAKSLETRRDADARNENKQEYDGGGGGAKRKDDGKTGPKGGDRDKTAKFTSSHVSAGRRVPLHSHHAWSHPFQPTSLTPAMALGAVSSSPESPEERLVWFKIKDHGDLYRNYLRSWIELIENYRSLPPDIHHHPCLLVKYIGQYPVDVFAKQDFLEKQSVQWWSVPRLQEMVACGGKYKTEYARPCFIPTLAAILSNIQASSLSK